MISLPDFREKQILFVQIQWGDRCGIRFRNDNIIFLKNDEVVNQLSCHKVFAVFIIGDTFITTRLIKEAQKYGISLFFLKQNLETYASINAQAEGNYLLRKKQYDLSEAEELSIAKKIVKNKAENQQSLLQAGSDASEKIHRAIVNIDTATTSQELLGIEGNITKVFFSEYFESIGWMRRTPRARQDIPNFLMDMGYTYLFHFIDSLLRLYGLDTYKGVYHKLFFQRRSLACDIEEPFRCIIDKQIMKSFNLKQINKKDFTFRNGQYSLSFDKSKKYNAFFSEAIGFVA